MKQQYENLQKQLQVIEQFEELFKSGNSVDYEAALGTKENPGTFVKTLEQADMAFDGFKFPENDERVKLVKDGILKIKVINRSNASDFFKETLESMASFSSDKSERDATISKLRVIVQKLIAAQKAAVEKAIEETLPKAIAEEQAALPRKNRIAYAKKVGYYSGIATLATTGLSATTAAALMQFSPAFAVMVGVHLPVVALASIAVVGLVMTAAAAYLAYRAYKPAQQQSNAPATNAENKAETAPVNASTNSKDAKDAPEADKTENKETATNAPVAAANPKLVAAVNYGLIASGVSLMSFSGAMFSSKFALMVGVNLSPVALAGIAIVGALLLSVALYRMYQSKAKTPAPAANDAPAAETKTYTQRAYEYAASFRSLFKSAPAEVKAPENNNTSTVTPIKA